VLTTRHIKAPADDWPRKILAVSSANAAMQNYFSGYKRRTSPSPALTGLHGQVGPNAPQLIWTESVSVDENSEKIGLFRYCSAQSEFPDESERQLNGR